MIRYVLACGQGHTFEAWFRDGAGYVKQVEAKQVACPICGSAEVAKAPMAPNVAAGDARGREVVEVRGDKTEPSQEADQPATDVDRVAGALKALRKYVETHATDVGREFPEEARRMHYGETEPRSIFGQADLAEARSLREEGIPCLRVPWGDRRGN